MLTVQKRIKIQEHQDILRFSGSLLTIKWSQREITKIWGTSGCPLAYIQGHKRSSEIKLSFQASEQMDAIL